VRVLDAHAQLPALLAGLRRAVPGVEAFDAHTHIGADDPDGYRCSPAELLDLLAAADARGVVFPMHEPGGYGPANDAAIAAASSSDARLVPFCRLDPHDSPLVEAERCLARGARGIKLHPRAEAFDLDHPALESVFALADERRLPVLCHAGRGIPALGRHAVEACERFPGMRLILAHAAICDLGWIWSAARERPNLLFDTAWWSASDLQALLALVPPGQVLYGSDAPYGVPALSTAWTVRHALQVGLTEEQVRGVMGGQVERLLRGEDLADLGPAPGAEGLPRDPLLDRVHSYLLAAAGQMFAGLPATEVLALALLACEVGEEAPHARLCALVASLIRASGDYVPPGPPRPSRLAPGLQLIVLAAALARTPDVPLPGAPA
jgi:predicted TIM-barrel fold metal-dependent hydrolase